MIKLGGGTSAEATGTNSGGGLLGIIRSLFGGDGSAAPTSTPSGFSATPVSGGSPVNIRFEHHGHVAVNFDVTSSRDGGNGDIVIRAVTKRIHDTLHHEYGLKPALRKRA